MAMASAPAAAHEEPLTYRRDAWWVFPLFTFVVYAAFLVYGFWRVFEPALDLWVATGAFTFAPGTDIKAYYDAYYVADNGAYHYLAPFGTPDFTRWVPAFLLGITPLLTVMLRNPGFLILPFPAGFRFTCYYYRKSYYRAFTLRPVSCAVPAPKGAGYKGERGLMVVQNIHRYFLYAAIVVWFFLTYDALASIWTPGNPGFYFGFGSALMLVNIVLIGLYTFGCHSFRHLVGGKLDMYSCDPLARWRYGFWSRVTMLNERHALWAWLSLISVAATDLYIRWLAQNPGMTHLFGMVPV